MGGNIQMNMDLKSLSKLMIAMAAALVITACSSTDTADGEGSTSDMAGGDQNSGAMSTGAGADGELGSESMAGGGMDDAAALKTVFYFDFDQSALTSDARAALDAQAARLRDTAGAVRLEGHADERGTREYNLALGERRAKAIANYLAIQGVDRSRIETISYGEEKPVAFGQNEQSWSMNRRVELK